MSKEKVFDDTDAFDEKEMEIEPVKEDKDNTEPMRDISTRQPKISLRSGAKGVNDTQYFTGIDVVDSMTIDTLSVTKDGTYTPPSGVMGYNRVEVNCNKQPVTSGATIYDYDGTVIETYTPEEFAALSAYPAHPEHEYLTPNGYNVALATAQAYAAKYGYVEVGAQYRVTDGKTRLFMSIEEFTRDIRLGLCVNGSVDVDWGDGTTHSTMTSSDIDIIQYAEHTYAQSGDYIIALTVTGEAVISALREPHFIAEIGADIDDYFGSQAHFNCLTKILFGENISVEHSPFLYFWGLKTVLIPVGMDISLAEGSFGMCYNLKSLTIPNGFTSLPNDLCTNCESLSSLILPHTIISIPEYVADISAMTTIVIPDSVTSINDYAFSGGKCLNKVVMSDNVTSIGQAAFSVCRLLNEISLPANCTTYGNNAFGHTSIVNLEIPAATTTINAGFTKMHCLKTLKFRSSTPPTITGSNPWQYLPTDCIIYVPTGSLSAYTSAANYPDPNTYTYVEY